MGLPLFGTPKYKTHEEAVQHAAEKTRALAKAEYDLAELKAYFSEVTEELFDASAWVDEASVNFLMQARGGGEGLVLGSRQSLAQTMESVSIDDVLNIGIMTGTDFMPHAKRYLEYLNRKAYFVSKVVEGVVRLRSMITRVKSETMDVARTNEWTCEIAQVTLQIARLKLKYLRH